MRSPVRTGPVTETVVNGVRIRDHRRDRTAPVEIPLQPAHMRRIPPALTADISDRIFPFVRECAAAVPAAARIEKPRVEGDVVIAIKDHQVQIRSAKIDLVGVADTAVEATARCIEEKALRVTTPAADEADLEEYPIRLSYGLP